MRVVVGLLAAFSALSVVSAIYAFQQGAVPSLRSLVDDEDNPVPTPSDASEKTEWAFARLQYPTTRYGGSWNGRASWPTDYPKADRQFVQGVRRLTRLHTRSVEQVVNLDSDEVYNWPWMYAVEVGHWDLTDAQCRRLREYLTRGGFLMVDDFHGTWEWATFVATLSRVFPDRPVVDVENKDALFHVLYDLDERFQVPGIQYWYSGRIYEKDGDVPEWKAVYDDKGRVMVAICHNMDLGDAWEWADHPAYPEKYASLAYRIGVNYIIYAMSH